MKVYFDQNVWQYTITEFPVCDFEQKLRSQEMEICLGLHNIYEFARCFLDEKNARNIQKGKEIFQYLERLNIGYFVNTANQLIDSDLVYARTGGRLLPYLSEFDSNAARQEISRLARGWCNRASKFIRNREDRLAKDMPGYRRRVRRANIKVSKPKDFCELRDDWRHRRMLLIQSEFGEKAKHISDSVLFSNPGKYPYLNTYINSELYFNFIALTSCGGPSKKSTSDYRHLINANAADYFVTEDKRIRRNSEKLCPYVSIHSWNEFDERLAD